MEVTRHYWTLLEFEVKIIIILSHEILIAFLIYEYS